MFALLYGEDIRLIADAPVGDLTILDQQTKNRILAPYRQTGRTIKLFISARLQSIREKRNMKRLQDFSLTLNFSIAR